MSTVSPSASTSKKSASKAKVVKPTRPSWKDIIKECIAANSEDARRGVSRNTIKRFAEEAYKIDMSGLNLSQLNRAITSGTEGGTFILPKGPSGKVKLAPMTKPLTSASKENSKPPSKAPPTSKKAALTVAKKAAAPKKVLAKVKPTMKASKRGAAKQAITGSKPGAAKKTAVKKAASAKKK